MKPTAPFAGVALACIGRLGFCAQLTVEVHDQTGHPLPDAVLYAEPLEAPSRRPPTTPKAVIDQVNKQFVPLVTIVQAGTEVSFPNSDNIRHSIYSFSPAKTFATKLYSGKQAAPVIFDTPGVAVLGCNIHDAMAAWVIIVDTPYFGKSGPDGVATLDALPPGSYRLKIWYPGPKFEPVDLEVRMVSNDPTRQTVTLDTSSSILPTVRAHAVLKR